MKKLIIKLYKSQKVSLVEPNSIVSEAYAKKSKSNIISARILLDNNHLEESVALVYYSMYNLVQSLFFRAGIKSENHTASLYLLKEIFDIDNKSIIYAKEERVDKQYYTDFKITKQEVLDSLKTGEDFNNLLFDFISRINSKDIKKYQDKFKEVVKWKIN